MHVLDPGRRLAEQKGSVGFFWNESNPSTLTPLSLIVNALLHNVDNVSNYCICGRCEEMSQSSKNTVSRIAC